LGDWVCFPLYYVSKLIRDNGVIVAQVGEGSDELFCGYDIYLTNLRLHKIVSRYYSFWPQWIKKVFYKLNVRLGWLKNKPLLLEYLRRTSEMNSSFGAGPLDLPSTIKEISCLNLSGSGPKVPTGWLTNTSSSWPNLTPG